MPTISEHDALPTGTRLGEFEIQQVLGIGGFGLVYLAFDHALERQVAIKEYMPAALANRGFGAEVVVRSASHAETFMLGMRSFINEARLLARFDHPSLVKVYRFWEQHGTAYMVMPYYKGRTLQEVRRDMTRPPDEAWLRRLITPLLGALECLHRENVYHRDVAPDNILLLDDESGPGRGQPVLLDLGAARRVIGDHTQTLTAIVKPSFAPIEQYAETVQLRQGPWTDLYALAAVVHFCITGRPPMPATVRTVHDDVATLQQMSGSLAAGYDCHFSEAFVQAIDHALAVRPQERPESVAAWREELNGSVARPMGQDKAALEPKSVEWMAETVLLRSDTQEDAALRPPVYMTTIPAAGRLSAPPAWPPPVPAGHAAGSSSRATSATPASDVPKLSAEAAQALRHVMATTVHAIAATVPIARPAVARQAEGASADVAQEALVMPITHPLGVVHRREEAPSPPAPATPHPWAVHHSPPWLRWGFATLALMMGLAIWWSHARNAQPQIVSASEAAGLTASTSLASPPSSSGQEAPEQAKMDSGKVNKAAADTREPERPPRHASGRSPEPAPWNPRRACGDRSFILLAICMKRHCAKPEYAGHSECARMRQQEESQRGNYYP